MPLPEPSARLALIHTETWTVVGNQSHPHDPAIYEPGWVLEEQKDGKVRVLAGVTEKTLEPREAREPLWRKFSTKATPPRIDGYVAEFNSVSTFVVAVQCAARRDVKEADVLWDKFNKSEWISDGFDSLRYKKDKRHPESFLAAILFDRLELNITQASADLGAIAKSMSAILADYPDLADPHRKDLLDSVSQTAHAKPPEKGSVEDLLIACGKWDEHPADEDEPKTDGPREKLIRMGFDAIPELLRLGTDRRLTSQRFGAFMMCPSKPKLLGDIAREILAQLLPDGNARKSGLSMPVTGDFSAAWEQARKEKELDYYLRNVWSRDKDGNMESHSAAYAVLASKAPEVLPKLVSRFENEAKNGDDCWNLAKSLVEANLPAATKTELLVSLAGGGSISRRRSATQILAGFDQAAAQPPALALMRMLPRDAQGAYWTSSVAAVSHVVLAIDDDAVWQMFFNKTSQASVGLRLEWMNPFNYLYVGDRSEKRRLAFLAGFLEDTEVRDSNKNKTKFDGPCAAFTFPKIAVRDFAAMHIAAIWKLDQLDFPDATWTAARWRALRTKVEQQLKEEHITPMKPN